VGTIIKDGRRWFTVRKIGHSLQLVEYALKEHLSAWKLVEERAGEGEHEGDLRISPSVIVPRPRSR
jgi:hypothetical protein